MRFWRRLVHDESGQDLIEYALLCTLIGILGAVSWDLVRTAINTTYSSWNTSTNTVWEPSDPGGGGS